MTLIDIRPRGYWWDHALGCPLGQTENHLRVDSNGCRGFENWHLHDGYQVLETEGIVIIVPSCPGHGKTGGERKRRGD